MTTSEEDGEEPRRDGDRRRVAVGAPQPDDVAFGSTRCTAVRTPSETDAGPPTT